MAGNTASQFQYNSYYNVVLGQSVSLLYDQLSFSNRLQTTATSAGQLKFFRDKMLPENIILILAQLADNINITYFSSGKKLTKLIRVFKNREADTYSVRFVFDDNVITWTIRPQTVSGTLIATVTNMTFNPNVSGIYDIQRIRDKFRSLGYQFVLPSNIQLSQLYTLIEVDAIAKLGPLVLERVSKILGYMINNLLDVDISIV